MDSLFFLLKSRLGLSLGNCLWLLLFAILVIISVQSPILEITEQNLADHMIVEHTIFFFLGAASVRTPEITLRILVLFAYRGRGTKFSCQTESITEGSSNSLRVHTDDKNMVATGYDVNDDLKTSPLIITVRFWSNMVRKIFGISSKYGFLWLSIPMLLVALWHWPPLFDYAVLHENIHILQHISFIIVGATAFISLRTRGESFKIIILITINACMGFAGLLFSVTTDPVYSVYSVSGHNEAGDYMLITCIVLLLIGFPAYLIHRALVHIRIRINERNATDNNSSLG